MIGLILIVRIFLCLAFLSIFHRDPLAGVDNNQIVLLISLDGFKYDYVSETNTPFIVRLLRNGSTGNMVPTFATKTLPNHHSIATGCYQETHGVVHNHMYDPEVDEEYHSYARNDTAFWFSANPKVVPIYIANQLANPYAASVLSPWIAGQVGYGRLQHRARHVRPFKLTASPYDLFAWALNRIKRPLPPLYQRVNLAMIYLPEPDYTGHYNGPEAEPTLKSVRQLDNFIKHVYTELEASSLLPQTNIILLSDHGLSSVDPKNKRTILTDILPDIGQYRADGGNPLYHIRPVAGQHGHILRTLQEHSTAGHYDVYDRKDILERWHYRNHRRIGDILVVAHNGWSLFRDQKEADLGEHARGEHGYDNLEPDMRPLFLATGPAFKQAYNHSEPFENVDIYPLLLHLLGLPPHGRFFHEGSFGRIKHLLRQQEISETADSSKTNSSDS